MNHLKSTVINYLLIGFFLFTHAAGFAQITLSGNVLDATTNEPLAYVNIGILGKNIGTTSNGSGNFELVIPSAYQKESLKFSMIGYASKTLKISEIDSKDLKIKLESQTFDLVQPTIVASQFKKTKVLGNKANSKSTIVAFQPVKGFEIGSRIKIKKRPTVIKKFGANLARTDIDSMVFRLNFYDVKDGLPNKSILSENIIISNKDVTGRKLSVDLSEYDIIVEDDFYVTLECVDYYGENELDFCGSVFRGPRVTERQVSQGDWAKVKIASIAFNVTVKY